MTLCLLAALAFLLAWVRGRYVARFGDLQRDPATLVDAEELRRLREQAQARRNDDGNDHDPVNVNKIAVLRNSRGGAEPDVVRAAQACLDAGAHGITVHPRPDRRHITAEDVLALSTLTRAHPPGTGHPGARRRRPDHVRPWLRLRAGRRAPAPAGRRTESNGLPGQPVRRRRQPTAGAGS
ncbi:hypothetical protein G6F68_013486 [Rhizopus microsporus]|nr:hypothetical protein G6F68_013486 [Rhizopus microsporus]